MGAPVVWFEVAGRDLDALRQFYGSLFGWRIDLDPAAPTPYCLVSDAGANGLDLSRELGPEDRHASLVSPRKSR